MIRILEYGKNLDAEIFAHSTSTNDVSDIVADIIKNVKQNKDKALFEYSLKFDKANLTSLKVTDDEIENALNSVDKKFIKIIKSAANNIRKFHKKQLRKGFELKGKFGVITGQKVSPIERVGLYVPGGTASYPSTVLMDAIPAKIAGVEKIVMVTPPNSKGEINPVILAAAYIAGVDEIYKVGGAQAIAALAYGTETIPKVYKIVGPGNAFVAEAKKQVFGTVAIDMIAGPSEILVIADDKNNPVHISADLLSQAEHDKMASAVLITDSMDFAKKVQAEIEKQLQELPRYEIANASIENNGKIIVTDNLLDGIKVANNIAPEHLELCVDNPFDYLPLIKNAGSVFLGRFCPEALGDYYAGLNHTLPTIGTAKFSSPLSVDDFIKKTQYAYYTKEGLCAIANDVNFFALQEGLHAHAKSAIIRIKE